MASCLFWGNWILQLCRKSNWIALMWWLITSLDYYAKSTAVSELKNKLEAPSLLLTCGRHFYANVNGFYKSHDFFVKNEKFWRKKKEEIIVKSRKDVGGLDSRVPLEPRFMQIYVCTSCIFGLHIRTPWFLPLQIHHLPKLKEWQDVFTCTLRVREEVVLTTVFIFSVSKLGEVVELQR